MNEKETKNPNIFIRILIIFLCGFLAYLILWSYHYAQPNYKLTNHTILLVCFLIILVLSESFDSFSVGKIISLKKNVKNKESEVARKDADNSKLQIENTSLRESLIRIQSTIAQSQNNTTINYSGQDIKLLKELLKVEAQSEADRENGDEADEEKIRGSEARRKDKIPLHRLREYYERDGLVNYCKHKGINPELVQKGIKLNDAILEMDPISKIPFGSRFDGYLANENEDVFLDVKAISRDISMRIFLMERPYVQLSRIKTYSEVKKKAKLVYILIKFSENNPDWNEERFKGELERFKGHYSPAIEKGLLEIHIIETELDKYVNEYQSKE